MKRCTRVRGAINKKNWTLNFELNTMANKNINLTLKVWRQKNAATKGKLVTYQVKDVSPDASFLEMMDILNEDLVHKGKVTVSHVAIKKDGHIDLEDLENQLKKHPGSLVSLMHANNEIGNITPIEKVSELCKKYDAIFHSDTVQSVCHYPIDLQKTHVAGH